MIETNMLVALTRKFSKCLGADEKVQQEPICQWRQISVSMLIWIIAISSTRARWNWERYLMFQVLFHGGLKICRRRIHKEVFRTPNTQLLVKNGCATLKVVPPVVDEKSSHVLTKPNIPLSKELGAQVRNMPVSSNSIFQCGHHDILAFSVSYMSIKIKILLWMDHPMKQFSTPCMTAAHVDIHVCIHFI